jgi:thiol:disulfide interchange protein DsbC
MKSLRSARAARAALAAAFAAALLAALPVHANETIRKVVEARFDLKVDKVTKTEHLGLYEVLAEGQILYTDENATTFFVGSLYDGRTGTNLTAKRIMSFLPYEAAVKQVRGNGKGTLVTFEDPNCGYCKRLARDIQKLKDVTVYTFVIPILGEDSTAKTRAILCAPDRAKAWNDWMINNVKPAEAKKDCKPPIDRLLAASQGFQITGTPTILFADGTKAPGAIPAAEIEKKLAELAKRGS